MSSNVNITGLLAELINGTTESAKSTTPSVRKLNSVSFSTAYYKSKSKSENNRTTPSINATKKAIVLGHVEKTPLARVGQAPSETSWWDSMIDQLPRFGLSEEAENAIASTGVTNYPKYFVWILPDKISSDSILPVVIDNQIANLSLFPVCSIKNEAVTERLVDGALIRIDFENRLLKNDPYIVSVMNNKAEFGRVIFNELERITSPEGEFAPCNEQGVAVAHASGDTIGTAADDFQSEELIYINGDAIYPYTEGMTNADLVVFYHGIETGKTNKQEQNTILAELESKVSQGKLFIIPEGHDKPYSSIEGTISELENRGITIGDRKLGFWSGGAVGGKTALESDTFSQVEIADPSPQSSTIPSSIRTPGDKIDMTYNRSNWGTQSYYTNNIDSYVAFLTEHEVDINETDDNHKTIMIRMLGKLL